MADSARLAAARFSEHRIAVSDDVSIAVRDYAAEEPETGLPVVCLHGATRNAKDFELVAPRIAALGRRVIAMSMRGHGASDRDPNAANYGVPTYLSDVIAALNRLDVDEAVFIGTSLGGIISMFAAASHPGRVSSAVLNDIGPVLDAEGMARIAQNSAPGAPASDWEGAARTIRDMVSHVFPDRRDDMAFWRMFARRTWRARADGMIEADYDPAAVVRADPSAPPPDLSPLFQAVAARPVLVVRGGISELLSEAGVAHMRALKPDLKVVVAVNVGHPPMLEEPEVWDAVLDFLARVP